MSDKPIIFSGPMVRAILEGRKTMTRRVVKPQPQWPNGLQKMWGTSPPPDPVEFGTKWLWREVGPDYPDDARDDRRCPYGEPGSLLWVRETWADVNSELGPSIIYRADSEVRGWEDFSTTFGPDEGAGPSMDYESYPGDYCMWWEDLVNGDEGHSWRPSTHMPRWASRITLRVTGVRVERLQDISEEDAIAEGIDMRRDDPEWRGTRLSVGSHVGRFAFLWESIHGPGSWAADPWVWVISFERRK